MESIKLAFCSKLKNKASVTLRVERVVRGATVQWKRPPSREDLAALREGLKKLFGSEVVGVV